MPRIAAVGRLTSVSGKVTRVVDQREDVKALAEGLGQSMVRLAYVLTGNPDDAQDVVQTVFVKLLSTDLSNVADLDSYARRSVANEVLTRGRRLARLRGLVPKLAEPATVEAPDTVVANRQLLASGLARLSSRQRTVLVLRYLEDFDDDAIADVIGCSSATVRSIAARALGRLRAGLDAER
jgi:RNA polymerase sigma factor (sigma-70 family)